MILMVSDELALKVSGELLMVNDALALKGEW